MSAWRKLTPRGRARLKAAGVKPVSYNAWARKTPAQKAKAGGDRAAYIRGETRPQKRQSTRRRVQRYVALPPEQRRKGSGHYPYDPGSPYEIEDADMDRDFWDLYDDMVA